MCDLFVKYVVAPCQCMCCGPTVCICNSLMWLYRCCNDQDGRYPVSCCASVYQANAATHLSAFCSNECLDCVLITTHGALWASFDLPESPESRDETDSVEGAASANTTNTNISDVVNPVNPNTRKTNNNPITKNTFTVTTNTNKKNTEDHDFIPEGYHVCCDPYCTDELVSYRKKYKFPYIKWSYHLKIFNFRWCLFQTGLVATCPIWFPLYVLSFIGYVGCTCCKCLMRRIPEPFCNETAINFVFPIKKIEKWIDDKSNAVRLAPIPYNDRPAPVTDCCDLFMYNPNTHYWHGESKPPSQQMI